MQKTKKEAGRSKRPGMPGPATQATLHVRLWADGGPEDAVPAGALAMVEDFLRVSPCETIGAGLPSASGLFSDAVQAVNAGRRLQRMLRGYSKAAQGALGAGLLLTSNGETVSDAEMVELRQKQALSRAKPGQMFVVGALCDTVRSIPGLEFKEIDDAFADAAGGKPRQILFVLPAIDSSGRADEEMKTRLVEGFARPQAQHKGSEARTPGSLILKPVATNQPAPAATQVAPREATSGVQQIVKPADRVVPAAAADEALPVALWSRPLVRWASAGTAALVVVAAFALGMRGKDKAKAEPAIPATSSASGPVPSASGAAIPVAAENKNNPAMGAGADAERLRPKADPGTLPKPIVQLATATAPAAAAPTVTPNVEPAAKSETEAKPEVAKREPEKPAAPPTSASEPKASRPSAGGVSVSYSAEQLAMLLARADKDSGDGYYDRAIQEYQSVLSHDPGNQRARQGKERAVRNKNGG